MTGLCPPHWSFPAGMFFVHQDFLTYKSGVYSPNPLSPMLGGHAIKIMGFGEPKFGSGSGWG